MVNKSHGASSLKIWFGLSKFRSQRFWVRKNPLNQKPDSGKSGKFVFLRNPVFSEAVIRVLVMEKKIFNFYTRNELLDLELVEFDANFIKIG